MWRSRLTLSAAILFLCNVASGEDLHLYFGLLHGHTSFSDGSDEPDDAFEMAKDAGLDFMAITEHNHHQAAGDDGIFLTPPLYTRLRLSAQNHTADGQFVAIWGQEVSTISSGNHVNIFFAGEICNVPNGHFRTLYEEWLPAHPEVPFIQFNHPDVSKDQRPSTRPNQRNNDYGIDDYDQDWDRLLAASAQHVALIEMIIGPAFATSTSKLHHNGTHEDDYLFYLNKGFRLAPSVGQDNHHPTWGKATHARMGVWAETLSRDGLVEAIRARRCYASEDENIRVWFTVNDEPMGSIVRVTESSTATIFVEIEDEDEPDAEYRVRIFYDDGVGGDEAQVIEDVRLDADATEITFVHVPDPGGYYFAKITQDSDHNDDVWTAPVWIAGASVDLIAGNTDDPQEDEIDWAEATNYVGQEVTVTGEIIRSFNYRDRILFFNFDQDYENSLSLVVLAEDFDTFGGADALLQRLTNKNVQVRGEITLYRGERMQLRLTKPDQIIGVDAE